MTTPLRGIPPRRAGAARVFLVAMATLPALLAACGGGSSVVRPGTSVAPTTPSASTTAPSTPGTTAPAGSQQVTVSPSSGLRSPQTVLVRASGFSPGGTFVVTECAAKGQATGPGDCNLDGMQTVTADATGALSVHFTVVRGPFGANRVECSATQQCIVSVNQATFAPTEQALAEIRFG